MIYRPSRTIRGHCLFMMSNIMGLALSLLPKVVANIMSGSELLH